MTEQYALDRAKVRKLLKRASSTASITEEQLHPWSSSCFPPFNFPLLRLWDHVSGSQPDEQNRMNSRALDERLDTLASRQTSLAIHINHKNWTPTPYVSFTSKPTAIEEMVEWRQRRRGRQTLTVIHPNTRLRNGLPILDLAAEMKHYNVRNPYGSQDQYCKDHYICLWQVTETEIIGHWDWAELVKSGDWYQRVVMPAFRDFTPRSTLLQQATYSGLLILMDELCLEGQPATGTTSRVSEVANEAYFSEDEIWYSDGSAGDDFDYNFEHEDWDTDDEVEEANAADDIIRFIEETIDR